MYLKNAQNEHNHTKHNKIFTHSKGGGGGGGGGHIVLADRHHPDDLLSPRSSQNTCITELDLLEWDFDLVQLLY